MSELLEQSHRSPQRFGPYRRVGELGAGAMGAVLEVEHTGTGGRYALKLILPNALDATTLARFEREAQTMGQLNHPHVARIHAAQLAPPLRYLVLDLYPGGTLKDRIKAGPLPIESAVSIAAKLADGLAHAHAHGILHRDIKPANVLFDEQGQPVLSDFGLARGCNAQSLTRTGELLGTPLYMAPEQVIDGKRTGPEADVYALGALLYLMLTGRPPIEAGQALLGTLERVISEVPRPASEARPEVPPNLDALCRRTLSKDPEERPTATEFSRALRAAPSKPPQASRVGRRVLLLAFPLLAVAAAVTSLVWLLDPAPASSSPPQREEAPAEAPARRPRPGQPPPPWIEGLHDLHVTLTLSDDRNLLSLLARCEVEPSAEGTWSWTLVPVCVRAWNGTETSRFVEPPRRGDPSETQACAQFLSAPLALHFDTKGDLEAVDSPGSPALDPPRGSLEQLAANLDPRGLRSLAEALLATPSTRSSRLISGRIALDRSKALVGAVWPLAYGWAALQPVPVATVGALKEDKTIEVLGQPGSAPTQLHEGLLLATNGLDDPDGATRDPSRSLSGVLELPVEGAQARLRDVRPPFELVGSLTESGVSTQAFTRPWGTPLGGVREGLPYLELPNDVDDWTAIAWQGGEAWVRSAQLASYPGRSWVGVITAAKHDPLDVHFEPGDEPPARPRLGSLRHGQAVPIFGVEKTSRYVDMEGGAWIMLPRFGTWCQTTWGTKQAHVRASRPIRDGDHELYVFLLPSGTPSRAGFANGRVPEAPRSSDSPR